MKKQSQWKLLADLNISIKTVEFLKNSDIDIIRIEKSVSSDYDVVKIAKLQERAILTFDKDFGEIYYFHKEKTMAVIVLSLQDQTADSVNVHIQKFLNSVNPRDVQTKLVILYEHKYRLIG